MINKFCFIIVYNDENRLSECLNYINRIIIPEGYDIDLMTVSEVNSMAEGYQEAMEASDAEYKIYLHQDTYIINENILGDLFDIFKSDDKIGAVGNIGSLTFLGNTISLPNEVYGEVISMKEPTDVLIQSSGKKNDWKNSKKKLFELDCIWGPFFATRYDIDWEELIENDWNYYSVIHSLSFREKGYKLVVPKLSKPWIIHDGNNQGLSLSIVSSLFPSIGIFSL